MSRFLNSTALLCVHPTFTEIFDIFDQAKKIYTRCYRVCHMPPAILFYRLASILLGPILKPSELVCVFHNDELFYRGIFWKAVGRFALENMTSPYVSPGCRAFVNKSFGNDITTKLITYGFAKPNFQQKIKKTKNSHSFLFVERLVKQKAVDKFGCVSLYINAGGQGSLSIIGDGLKKLTNCLEN